LDFRTGLAEECDEVAVSQCLGENECGTHFLRNSVMKREDSRKANAPEYLGRSELCDCA
jgi:hypothetical protein